MTPSMGFIQFHGRKPLHNLTYLTCSFYHRFPHVIRGINDAPTLYNIQPIILNNHTKAGNIHQFDFNNYVS